MAVGRGGGVRVPKYLVLIVTLPMIVPSVLIGSSSHLQVIRTGIKSWTSSMFYFCQIRLFVSESHALRHQTFSPKTYNRENVVDLITPLFLTGSSSHFQITRTGMKYEMSLKLGHTAHIQYI